MRRTSVSLPTRNVAHDPHEKAGRYSSTGARQGAVGILEKAKSAWMTQSQRSRYLKTGGILVFVIFLFYYFTPAGVDVTSGGKHTVPANVGGQATSDPSLGTTKCTKSSDKSKPIVQYALMIDAGSTGSRIHVYRFNNCGATPELESEDFKMTEPKKGGAGLSSYNSDANGVDAEGAAKSLDVLMDVAMEKVPEKLKGCTPVAVKATAGLRLLGTEKSEKILEAVRTRLETVYPFPVISKEENGVAIMDGMDEGVYAWITTNFLLGNIGSPEKTPTAAVFDLGGGSTQVVFEPNFKVPAKMKEGEHKYKLSFAGRDFELYQQSHLGYGLMSARKAIHSALIENVHKTKPDDTTWPNAPVTNPCIAPGMTASVEVALPEDHPLGQKVSVNMTGPSSAAPAQCRALAEQILKKDKECKMTPCSFNGVHQPSLEKTFTREDVYAFSYFYDRTQPLGMPDSFTLRDMQRLTDQVCGGAESWDVFSTVPGALEELKGRPEHCLDLSFMIGLLHTGYEMPVDREVKIAKKLKGNELGWCLGASLPLLSQNSGWKCRVKQVS
ncbi:guanosine-diphosphatase-like protein [Amylocarpus encephaloides]|uniref:guanosine-diphosphatase n=1 Tax=Amylocarpus encephaloides TaxID=45428 RepID=A0A9P7YLQ2_9HELO|nr:guanosine-diphosphatase-like protein [Amylocarpus encephaloides]